MKKYNKISMVILIFAVLFCISTIGTVSAADTENSTGPTVTANLTGGTYNTTQSVSLISNDTSATIYYANDTTDPRNSSTRIAYTSSIIIDKTTTLRYAAVDLEGNWGPLYLQNYVIGTGKSVNNTGQSNYTGPQTNTTKWKYDLKTEVLGSPAIGPDGTIYIGTYNGPDHSGSLYAFNPNGTLKWKYTPNGGIMGTPAIGSDGTIYVGTQWGVLYAFNPNGTVKWAFDTYFSDTGSENKTTIWARTIYSSPVIGADGTIYITTCNGGGLYAIKPDGTLKWKYKVGNADYISPAIAADGTIYIPGFYNVMYDNNGIQCIAYTQHCLYAINHDGTLKWKYLVDDSMYKYSPSIGPDGTIYIGNYHGKLYAINPNGTLKWTYMANGEIWNDIKVGSDGTIYFGTRDSDSGTCDRSFYAINPTNGTLKWKYRIGEYIMGYVIGADGTIYVGSGSLYAFTPDGIVKWKYTAGGSPTIGPDGTLYFGSRNGNIYAIKDPVPVANFKTNTTKGTGSLTVKFTDTSTGNPTSWKWDFGDGQTSTEQNPTHTYSAPGKYTVKLTVTSNYGSDEEIKTSYITVNVPDTTKPTANANIKSGLYNTNKTITLKMSENGTIYYTLNGTTPTKTSTKYTGPITITTTTTLKFIAVDTAGNISPVYTQKYTIDKKAPKVTSTNPKNRAKNVSRTRIISIKFSEKIKKSINWSKIVVKNKYGKAVKISKWISGNILHIKTSKRSSYSWYTVYIPAYALKDYAGNKRTVKYTWRFKTGKY